MKLMKFIVFLCLISVFFIAIDCSKDEDTGIKINAPTNLTAVASGSSQVNLSWSDNSDNESGFEIQRSDGSSGYTILDVTSANTTEYSDEDVEPGNTYYYKVRAQSGTAYSGFTNVVSVDFTVSYEGMWIGDNCRNYDFKLFVNSSNQVDSVYTTLQIKWAMYTCTAPWYMEGDDPVAIVNDEADFNIKYTASDVLVLVACEFTAENSCTVTMEEYSAGSYIICGGTMAFGSGFHASLPDDCSFELTKY